MVMDHSACSLSAPQVHLMLVNKCHETLSALIQACGRCGAPSCVFPSLTQVELIVPACHGSTVIAENETDSGRHSFLSQLLS